MPKQEKHAQTQFNDMYYNILITYFDYFLE